MCGPLIGLAIGIIGAGIQTVMQIQAANLQADIAKTRAEIEVAQEDARFRGEQNDLLEDLSAGIARNRVAAAFQGTLGSASTDNIERRNREVRGREIAQARFSSEQIKGNSRFNADVAKVEAQSKKFTAIGNFIGGAASQTVDTFAKINRAATFGVT